MRTYRPKKCDICGVEFTPKNSKAKTCNKSIKLRCVICGSEYEGLCSNFNKLTCSTKCANIRAERTRAANRLLESRVCILCNKNFTPTSFNQKICEDVHKRQCVICGDWFQIDGIDRQACSSRCSQLLREATTELNTGYKYPGQSDEAKLKSRETCIERYGVDNGAKSQEVRSLISDKLKVAMKRPEVSEKRKATCLEKYGVDHHLKSEEVISKRISTCMERYNVPNVFASDEVRSKLIEVNKTRYGVDNPSKSIEVQQRIQSTNEERYGVPWYCMTEHCRASSRAISNANKSFSDRLSSLSIDHQLEYRIGLSSFDVYIPSKSLLIELNPSYTHSTLPNHYGEGKKIYYHSSKTATAHGADLGCIHIWDWDNIDKILEGLSNRSTVYARNCGISEVSSIDADTFLTRHHLQNTCRGQRIRLGLYHKDELVQIMTFGSPRYNKRYEYELLRLCTKSGLQIVGGASKLWKYAINHHKLQSVISYCDISKFDGNVYTAIGMELSHVTPPNKIWSKGNKMITDNLLRQRGFDQLFNTDFGKGSSNEELMVEYNWLPVYDCGQAVYHWAD